MGKILNILKEDDVTQEVLVEVDNEKSKAINYPHLTGRIQSGDIVYLNTTAINLGLGTGGYHYVLAKENFIKDTEGAGHIMKMRYTPQQVKVLAVEEEASLYHEKLKRFTSLENTPVLIGFLHSMILPALAGLRTIKHDIKVSYIMTDGGALPLAFSNTVKFLKKEKWLTGTVTAGHAFGGDLEAINIYSGLAAAFVVQKPEVILIAMGPGNLGTGTELGTTALEVGQIINAVHSLGGNPIVIPRISFQDPRRRHQGISHHVLSCLINIALAPCSLVLPILEDKAKESYIKEQVKENNLATRHRIKYEDGGDGLKSLLQSHLNLSSMGRSVDEDREFFLAASAAGAFTAKLAIINKSGS